MRRAFPLLLFPLALLVGAAPAPAPSPAAVLEVNVRGIRNAAGSIGVALFDETTASGFPMVELTRSTSVLASATGVTIQFEDLPPGRYALAVTHDENENGEVDTNEYGVPVEGFGFSNDAMGEMGPPTFAQAAIDVDGDTRATLGLIYMGGEGATRSPTE